MERGRGLISPVAAAAWSRGERRGDALLFFAHLERCSCGHNYNNATLPPPPPPPHTHTHLSCNHSQNDISYLSLHTLHWLAWLLPNMSYKWLQWWHPQHFQCDMWFSFGLWKSWDMFGKGHEYRPDCGGPRIIVLGGFKLAHVVLGHAVADSTWPHVLGVSWAKLESNCRTGLNPYGLSPYFLLRWVLHSVTMFSFHFFIVLNLAPTCNAI